MLIIGPGAVTGINIIASVDSFNITWVVPDVKTGPTNYSVEACPEVDDCPVIPPCENTTVTGVFADGKSEMHANDENVLQSS